MLEPAEIKIRIMTYNVHSCVGRDGKLSVDRIAKVIAAYEPDIVALQELDINRKRTSGEDQPLLIAEALEMFYHFHPSFHVEEGQYGNAILTRFPMRLVKAEKLPALKETKHTPGKGIISTVYEPRGAIWAEIDLGRIRLHVMTAHLGLWEAERLLQMESLLGEKWSAHPDCREPLILCGDFNAGPRAPSYRAAIRNFSDAQREFKGHRPRPTFWSHLPVFRLDHIFFKGPIRVEKTAVGHCSGSRIASDHLPLMTDLWIS